MKIKNEKRKERVGNDVLKKKFEENNLKIRRKIDLFSSKERFLNVVNCMISG